MKHLILLIAITLNLFQLVNAETAVFWDNDIEYVGSEKVNYSSNGRLKSIGKNEVQYWKDGRIHSIGTKYVRYDDDGTIRVIGNDKVYYWNNGKIAKIGTKPVHYKTDKKYSHRLFNNKYFTEKDL